MAAELKTGIQTVDHIAMPVKKNGAGSLRTEKSRGET